MRSLTRHRRWIVCGRSARDSTDSTSHSGSSQRSSVSHRSSMAAMRRDSGLVLASARALRPVRRKSAWRSSRNSPRGRWAREAGTPCRGRQARVARDLAAYLLTCWRRVTTRAAAGGLPDSRSHRRFPPCRPRTTEGGVADRFQGYAACDGIILPPSVAHGSHDMTGGGCGRRPARISRAPSAYASTRSSPKASPIVALAHEGRPV